jgi:chitinase
MQLDIEQRGYSRFVDLKKRYPNMKAMVSAGGYAEGGKKFSQMVSLPSRRQAFVGSVVGELLLTL